MKRLPFTVLFVAAAAVSRETAITRVFMVSVAKLTGLGLSPLAGNSFQRTPLCIRLGVSAAITSGPNCGAAVSPVRLLYPPFSERSSTSPGSSLTIGGPS